MTLCANLILAGILTHILFNFPGCHYDPSLYPVQDVLKPGPMVDIVGFSGENSIVTPEYIYWVEDLKAEIIRLRRLLEEK